MTKGFRTENTAETILADVLNPDSDDGEQCSGCEAAHEWDQTRSYCPYHQGVLDGHDRAFGDLSQAAIAFQVDPELMDTVLDARSRQKVYEYRALQREANKPEPEGLSEYEKEVRDVVHELDPGDR